MHFVRIRAPHNSVAASRSFLPLPSLTRSRIGAAIDRWTTGSGNYGKTPIFYAITRCRDDVVIALLRAGARVTLVNNKGQTPLSLAASHCDPSTVAAIQTAEAAALAAGGAWRNFRATHSDGREYGDLDPRFLKRCVYFIYRYILCANSAHDLTCPPSYIIIQNMTPATSIRASSKGEFILFTVTFCVRILLTI